MTAEKRLSNLNVLIHFRINGISNMRGSVTNDYQAIYNEFNKRKTLPSAHHSFHQMLTYKFQICSAKRKIVQGMPTKTAFKIQPRTISLFQMLIVR